MDCWQEWRMDALRRLLRDKIRRGHDWASIRNTLVERIADELFGMDAQGAAFIAMQIVDVVENWVGEVEQFGLPIPEPVPAAGRPAGKEGE